MRKIFTFISVLAIYLLLGCVQRGNISTPDASYTNLVTLSATESPKISSSLPSSTPQVYPSVTSTELFTPTSVAQTIDPTYLNFATNTPTPTLDPEKFLLRIINPGPMSKVVSPIDFTVHVAPDFTGTTRIELIGENGTELYRKVFKTYSNIGYYTRINEKIDFEIKGAAEIARLQISTIDANGRVQALNSVRLLLQSIGENEFSPSRDIQDRLLLRYPDQGVTIGGGNLPVVGEFKPADALPIILELIDKNGDVLGSRLLQLDPPDGKYQQFTTSIPFQVNKETEARLVFRQSDDRIDGLSYLFSQELILTP